MNFKKIGLISVLVGIILGLTRCDGYKTGDLIHNGRFEIIEIINSEDSIYEVRDTKEGVHYFTDIYYDNFSPVIMNNGKVKITEKNDKYVEKSSIETDITKKEVE